MAASSPGKKRARIASFGLAHDVGAVLGEAEVAAALGEDRDEGGVVQVVGVDQRAVEVEEERRPGHASAPARGRAVTAPV